MRVLGVDPGGATTGLVARDGTKYLTHAVISRQDGLQAYLGAVLQAVTDMDYDTVPEVLAVEDLNPPTPHLGMINVRWLMDTAQVLGAIRAVHPDAVMVPPASHGKTPDLPRGRGLDAYMTQHYPPALLGTRERGGKYTGNLRHARSAWSIAKAGMAVQQRFGAT